MLTRCSDAVTSWLQCYWNTMWCVPLQRSANLVLHCHCHTHHTTLAHSEELRRFLHLKFYSPSGIFNHSNNFYNIYFTTAPHPPTPKKVPNPQTQFCDLGAASSKDTSSPKDANFFSAAENAIVQNLDVPTSP